MQTLQELFAGHITSQNVWASRSLYVSSYDFYLLEFWNSNMYKMNHLTLEMKQNTEI
jgi:hypothetical protein